MNGKSFGCQTFLHELAQHHFTLTNLFTDVGSGDEFLHTPQQLYSNPREWVGAFPLKFQLFLGRNWFFVP